MRFMAADFCAGHDGSASFELQEFRGVLVHEHGDARDPRAVKDADAASGIGARGKPQAPLGIHQIVHAALLEPV